MHSTSHHITACNVLSYTYISLFKHIYLTACSDALNVVFIIMTVIRRTEESDDVVSGWTGPGERPVCVCVCMVVSEN